MIFIFKYIHLDIKKAYVQLIALVFYLSAGLLLIYGFRLNDAYYINEPIIKNTVLNTWVMLPIYAVIYLSIMFIVNYYHFNTYLNEKNSDN